VSAGSDLRPRRQRGAGLIEVAISLLVLSIGALGLGSLQLAAKRMGYEAIQRTEAAALAMDLFERLRANRVALPAYGTTGIGAGSGAQLPAPPVACDGGRCSAAQMSGWDLWQWERALDGAGTGARAGGLVRPTACVTVTGRRVIVEIAWQGFRPLSVPAQENACGLGNYGADDADRQWLQVSSWIGEE
jgi:type IV pilus assembly protein PilV